MTTSTLSPSGICCPPQSGNGVSHAFRSVWKSVRHWNKQRRDMWNLRYMSDKQLDDIGMHRSDIRSSAYGHSADRIHMLYLPRG